jgi:iron complex transport system permease protein
VLALVVGASLGLAGAVLQGATRNPLADPSLLGITNGAALAVVSGIAFFGLASPSSYVWVAIVGAGASAAFVYLIGSLGRGGATPLKLTLAGAASAAAFSSLVSAVLLPRIDVMNQFRFWQIGGVGGASWDRLAQVASFLVVGVLLCLGSARGLNTLALGDDVAAGLGQRVATTRLVAALGAVVLCGAATSVAGPIAFVGLIVPHLCRLMVGVDHRWLLPACVVVGGGLLTAADVAGRLVARPAEVDVGITMALLGAPVFIAIVRRQKVRGL